MSSSIFIGRELEDETKLWLEKAQVNFVECPLIQIQLNEPEIVFFKKNRNEFKSWLITSQWSAKWLLKNHKLIGFKRLESIFCISAKQRQIVSSISDNTFVSEKQYSASAVDLIKEKVEYNTIVYLAGNYSLNTFQKELKFPEYDLVEIEAYRNIPVKTKVENDFDAYLFFSPSGIESFINAGNIISPSAQIFTIGKTTGVAARKNFSNNVSESTFQNELLFVISAVHEISKSNSKRTNELSQ